MKIGILTLPLHTNYGGIIQAYALQTVLERMGHSVCVINRHPDIHHYAISPYKLPFAYAKRTVKKLFRDRHIVIRREQWMNRQKPLYGKHTDRFIAQYIHSFYVNNVADIQPTDFEAIVVGSDQIWREIYSKQTLVLGDNTNRFLAFADGWNIRRYAYAASFGVDKWQFSDEETVRMARLAKQFVAVSVREDSAVELCKQHLDIDAPLLPDPTLLLNRDDYRQLTDAAHVTSSPGDLFCYILDPSEEKNELIRRVAADRSLTPFRVKAAYPLQLNYPIELRCVPPVENWLRGFMDAKFVVTDSFHGMAFSINFGKPFIAVGNGKRGMSRMGSISRMFGIEDLLLFNAADYSPDKAYTLPPSVATRLEKEREKGRAFLARIK